ncbi:MAG: hypothetical protein ACR2GH_02725 [Pseudonocardia sp.]
MEDLPISAGWASGNVNEDTRETRGWLVGHFIRPSEQVRSPSPNDVKNRERFDVNIYILVHSELIEETQ